MIWTITTLWLLIKIQMKINGIFTSGTTVALYGNAYNGTLSYLKYTRYIKKKTIQMTRIN